MYTHELARRWVEWGHEVTVFCGTSAALPARDCVDGVRVVRRGRRFDVFREGRLFYDREARGRFDVVVDEVNTRPFLCPQWVDDVPVMALIFQVARDVWFHELPLPVAALGRTWLEFRWLRLYRDVPTLTISRSSLDSLASYGLRSLSLLPVGLDLEPRPGPVVKEARPTVVFLGRLAPNKRPDDALRAFELAARRLPGAQMWVIGTGPMEAALRARHASDSVHFFGRVGADEKADLLARAHALVVTSVREGWGMVVSEAAAAGTPAIGYDVPGLCDSVPASGGVLVRPTVESMADALVAELPRWRAGDAAVHPGGVAPWPEVARTALDHVERVAGAGAPPPARQSAARLTAAVLLAVAGLLVAVSLPRYPWLVPVVFCSWLGALVTGGMPSRVIAGLAGLILAAAAVAQAAGRQALAAALAPAAFGVVSVAAAVGLVEVARNRQRGEQEERAALLRTAWGATLLGAGVALGWLALGNGGLAALALPAVILGAHALGVRWTWSLRAGLAALVGAATAVALAQPALSDFLAVVAYVLLCVATALRVLQGPSLAARFPWLRRTTSAPTPAGAADGAWAPERGGTA